MRNPFNLHFWLMLMHRVYVLWKQKQKQKQNLFCVEFRSWCVLFSAITHYFLSKLLNNRKLNNMFINDSSGSYWRTKRIFLCFAFVFVFVFKMKVLTNYYSLLLLIFPVFSFIRRGHLKLHNCASRNKCYLNRYLIKLPFLFILKLFVKNISS